MKFTYSLLEAIRKEKYIHPEIECVWREYPGGVSPIAGGGWLPLDFMVNGQRFRINLKGKLEKVS